MALEVFALTIVVGLPRFFVHHDPSFNKFRILPG